MVGAAADRPQEALQRQLETAAVVTGRLAHDFGNILTGILGFAELSLTQLHPDSTAWGYVEEIVNAARNGAGWIRKLQAFSRSRKPRALPTSLAPLLTQEEDRFRQLWGQRVTFLVALADDLPAQLLGQLLDNAGEAVTERGVVTLSARPVELSAAACLDLFGNAQPGGHVEITIRDTGPGLSEETRQRLFRELFYSTKASRRGLGLALVHGILQAYKGGLCFGPDPGPGTTVRVFLPIAAAPEKESAQPPAAATPCGDCVLVVDDDPLVLKMACQVLANAGFQVQAAAGPHEAIDLCHARNQPFHLIVSDIVMPRMNGLEMVRHLQAKDASVNVLFISSQPATGPAADGLLDRYPLLKKPFAPSELVQAAAAALTRLPAPSKENPLTPTLDIKKEAIP